MENSLPEFVDWQEISRRLPLIFPEGINNRNYIVREIAAKTIFVMLYVGAVEGRGQWARPNQITKMTDVQAQKTELSDRLLWAETSLKPGGMKTVPGRWYAENTREPIRDETIRYGLLEVGAVVERQNLSTTSSKPRYALTKKFAELFAPNVSVDEIQTRIATWRSENLTREALSRIVLRNRVAAKGKAGNVIVNFPNGERRPMAFGPSSDITKAVVEEFSHRFLREPALVFLSESGKKIISQDISLTQALGINIEQDRTLPDIILADLGAQPPILVFVEVVASDGPINEARKKALSALTEKAGYADQSVAYLSAFLDRGESAFRRLSSELAWGSFVWVASEPDNLIWLGDSDRMKDFYLSDFL